MTAPQFERFERAGSRIESIQAQHENHEGRYFDSVGRPRKLALGTMTSIQRKFEEGIPTRELATQYGISTSLVLQICYFTPKGKPIQRPRPLESRPVIIPADAVGEGEADGESE